jgi:hypothetical protein
VFDEVGPDAHPPIVKLIDFAHDWLAEEYAEDSGALTGIVNLIRCWKQVATLH